MVEAALPVRRATSPIVMVVMARSTPRATVICHGPHEALDGDHAPQRLNYAEGDAVDCEAVRAREATAEREERDKRPVSSLERVRNCHQRHRDGAEGGHTFRGRRGSSPLASPRGTSCAA